MKIYLFFILSVFVATGNCCVQNLSAKDKEAIIGYNPKVRGFVGKPSSSIDTTRYNNTIQVVVPDYTNFDEITNYIWDGDTTPIFIDSLVIKDKILSDFVTTLIKPEYDTLNRRTVYKSDELISILQIDTTNNKTIITCNYSFDPSSISAIIKEKSQNLSYVNINSVPVLVGGNAVNIYFEKIARIRMSNPYPARSAIIKRYMYSIPDKYIYKNGVIESVEQ